MKSGVRKSGWPMPRLMMSRPCAASVVARARTANAFSSPMRSKARTFFSIRSRSPHHCRHQPLDRRRADLLHHRVGLDAQKLEHALDTGLAEGAEAPDVGSPNADGGGANAQRLDDVGAAAKT